MTARASASHFEYVVPAHQSSRVGALSRVARSPPVTSDRPRRAEPGFEVGPLGVPRGLNVSQIPSVTSGLRP